MSGQEEIELVSGSGNVFADLGVEDAGLWQLKVELAAAIIETLDTRGLTVRQAAVSTGVTAADFSRIRNARLQRFTVDRLLTVLNRLDAGVEISVRRRPLVQVPAA